MPLKSITQSIYACFFLKHFLKFRRKFITQNRSFFSSTPTQYLRVYLYIRLSVCTCLCQCLRIRVRVYVFVYTSLYVCVCVYGFTQSLHHEQFIFLKQSKSSLSSDFSFSLIDCPTNAKEPSLPTIYPYLAGRENRGIHAFI